MLTVVALMDVSFGTCGIRILTRFVLLGGKLWEGFGICPLIHTVIFCLNCLMLSLYMTLCKRVLSFITKCVHSDCYIVKAVARHAILHGHMTSPIGRSALYCGLRFKFDIGRLLDPRFDYCSLVWNNYLSNVSAELLANVSVLKDFLLFRDKPVPICLIRTILHVLLRFYAPADLLNRFVIWIYFWFFFVSVFVFFLLVPCVRFNNK